MAAIESLDEDAIVRYSISNVILSLFHPPPHARVAAEPAKSQHWDRGRKLSNSAPRRLFKNGFAKISVIKD